MDEFDACICYMAIDCQYEDAMLIKVLCDKLINGVCFENLNRVKSCKEES